MNDFDVIGEDIWFDGYKLGSLKLLPATVAERVREALLGNLSFEAEQEAYGRGYDDGLNAGQREDA